MSRGPADGVAGPPPPPPLADNTFRPSPMRAASLQTYSYKTRASSQPAGERVPIAGSPGSVSVSADRETGRGSPIVGGERFGVIGGARAPGRFAGALAAGTPTRANSFSGAEAHDSRNPPLGRTLSSHTEERPSRTSSASPYPTFSPSASPPGSPEQVTHHSPPKAGANVSRSRSQSLATGVRPDRIFPMPMSTMDTTPRTFDKGWDTSPPEAGNQSPFSRHPPAFAVAEGAKAVPLAHARFRQNDFTRGWGNSAPDSSSTGSALSSSVATALGGVQTTAASGFDAGGAGIKSGASSRRHSFSVIGGFTRRDMFDTTQGIGMSMVSPPTRTAAFSDAELLPDQLNNALSLEIDQNRRRGIDIEKSPYGKDIPLASSLPFDRTFGQGGQGQAGQGLGQGRKDPFSPEGVYGLGSSPRGRLGSFNPDPRAGPGSGSGVENREGSAKSRFAFEYQSSVGSPARNSDGGGGIRGSPDRAGAGPIGGAVLRQPPQAPTFGPGAIGGPAPPPVYDPRYGGGGGMAPYGGGGAGPGMYGRPPYGVPTGPVGQYNYARPNPSAYPFYPRPPANMPMYASPHMAPPPPLPYSPAGPPYASSPYAPSSYFPSSPTSTAVPLPGSTSPSFASLSLAELGKGLPLAALAPATPLYIIAFKAGRRDVYYCADPTLLISNGDMVLVEADRGSDLGMIIFDQLTPVDVREWQERQATAALLSGASQHMPPGMAVAVGSAGSGPGGAGVKNGHGGGGESGGGGGGGVGGLRVRDGDLKGADLGQLLAGCGPSGNAYDSGMGMVQRGPLAKEIIPKRIFAKSSLDSDAQAALLKRRNDEFEAMMICRERVIERGLPMQIVDAEYQWDRRKLTFYFRADRRVDFRELTKECFRIFKSRIWMSMVQKDDPR